MRPVLWAAWVLLFTTVFTAVPPLQAREKEKLAYGEGLIVNVPYSEAEVERVVQDVAQNGIIRGTKEYNKDENVGGAKAADSTRVFPPWTEGGKVFYKVRLQALDPRNFKDSGDVGTLAVRYVLQPQGDKNTVLRINAVFVEDFRRTVHASNGSVESSEYKDIRDRLDGLDLMKQQAAEAEKERPQHLSKEPSPAMNTEALPATQPAAAGAVVATDGVAIDAGAATQPRSEAASGQTLEQHVQDLRRQVERLVKAPGAPLKSAPFHTATTLSPLPTGTEVLVLISTPYWYGVETRAGQHGWMSRDDLELLP
jgi:polyhydroxyalkanoate synthesis regulator phasin